MAQKWRIKIAAVLGLILAVVQLYGGLWPIATQTLRAIHVALGLGMAFMVYPFFKKKDGRPDLLSSKLMFAVDFLFATGIILCCTYFITQLEALAYRGGNPSTMDVIVSCVAVLLVLESCRRSLGAAMPIIAVIFIVYAMLGNLPGFLQHRAIDLEWLSTHLFLTTEGVFGTTIGASATTVFLFVLFGAALEKTGGGEFFLQLAYSICGRYRGGTAKVAVVGSGLMGMISGSAVANVAGVGSIAIPLMKQTGYSADDAGAIEAVSASGGLIMPPVMGAAAFIMAENLGLPYSTIILAAALPATLYYMAILFSVDFIAGRQGLVGMPKEQLPKFKDVMKVGYLYIIPMLILIYFICIAKTSAQRAAFWGFVSIVVLYAVQKIGKEKDIRGFWKMFLDILIDGSRQAVSIVAACACAGIIVGVISLTGLGLTLSSALVDLAGGSLFLLLVYTAVACIILGMGLPVTACYIILAVLAAPAIIKLGVPAIAAHLFVMYYGVLSNITPPVALASYVAAGISKSKPLNVAVTSCKMSVVLFVLPFMFVYQPVLILQDVQAVALISALVTSVIGVIAISAGSQRYFLQKASFAECSLLLIGGFCMLYPESISDIVGIVLFAVVLLFQLKKKKGARTANV
ncbi:TRAP transporter, 4TM/12TM fusion protein [Oscillibacter sp. PC13]|uniref:TRAP transporter permease n=1 Tax=Oscillibacter sp. PC13 TaxID=1855299 RepID=UPI0008E3CC6F|nr:TRAP transporter permease [Oscillibacter sp. PC13]SFP29005.1 TRAP transporter, 4TM/12TM fusion protein [Oscillibacter sp. PC13]